jgi:serine protease
MSVHCCLEDAFLYLYSYMSATFLPKRLILILSVFLSFSQIFSQSVYETYVDGRIYVKFKSGTLKGALKENPRNIPLNSFKNLDQLISQFGISKATRPFAPADDDEKLYNVVRFEFKAVASVDALIRQFKKLPEIDYAEKVPLMKTDVVPNDPLFATGPGSVHLNQINAQNAWNIFNGNSNITVAIVDNAVMWTHVDLVQNTYTNTSEIANNNVDDDGNGYVDDVHGWDVSDWDNNTIPTNISMDHGTHCAGIAAGRTDNATGISSIGWNIKFIPVKCQVDGGSTSTVLNGYEGILYAAKARARIISCSWGNSGSSVTEQSVIDFAWNRGSIVIASAGNNGVTTQNFPGAYNHVFCVAAVDPTNVKSSYSNYGTWVDICAPGDNIQSTVPYVSTPSYNTFSGTSMATPMVAGLAGLMLSKSPGMTRADVLNCISSTAVNIYSIGANSFYAPNLLGAGRIEAYQAMICASTFSAIPPVANFYAFPLMTCPNTNVTFYDSSLYVPTIWAWTFQGGTPATSTSSNPIVQWSTPGTYSVSLTVTNANGNSTKTKLSYISVSGPQSLPFIEGFEGAQFLPSGWSANNIWNDQIFWTRRTGLGAWGTSTACAMFDNYTYNAAGERDEMRSPKFDFSNVATARLRFDVAYARYDAFYSDSLEVKLSTNCGATWTSIYIKGGSTLATVPDQGSQFVPTNTQWRRDTINISALTAGQGNVMFTFINRGHYGQPIYLDNINIVFPTPTLNVTQPASICVGSTVNYTNNSISAASYSWNFQGASPATSTASNPVVSYNTPGTYTTEIIGTNGTTTTSVTRTIVVVNYPSLSVNSPSICSGNSTTLTAGGATSYIWTNGTATIATTSSVVVNPANTTTYGLAGSNGVCASSSVTSVLVNPSPTLSATNITICPGTTTVINVTGASSYLWNTNATTSAITVNPPSTTIYSVVGTTNGCSSSKPIIVFVSAAINLSVSANSSVVCTADAATLSVTGATTYSWSNNTSGSQTTVNPTGNTTYTVSGTDGVCTGTSQITISTVTAPTLTFITLPTASICAGNSVTLTAFGAPTINWSTGANNTASTLASPSITTVYTATAINTGCSRTQTVGVTVAPSTVVVGITTNTNLICEGTSVTLTATGANSYTWFTSGGATTGATLVKFLMSTTTFTVNGLTNGCGGFATTEVTVIPYPSATITSSDAKCFGDCNGNFSITTVSGTGPFVHSLSSGSCVTFPCNNLCTGVYTLTTSSPGGCSSTTSFVIGAPTALIPSVTGTSNASCPTCPDGSASVNVTGGTTPYTYSWSPNGGATPTATGLLPGCYTVNILDANSCKSQTIACVGAFTGIGEQTTSVDLRIYPNPSSGVFNIELNGKTFSCDVYNTIGQLFIEQKGVTSPSTIDLRNYAKGVYVLKIQSSGKIIHTRIVAE